MCETKDDFDKNKPDKTLLVCKCDYDVSFEIPKSIMKDENIIKELKDALAFHYIEGIIVKR